MTALPFMFAVVKYRKVLENICADKGINVNFRHNLIELNYAEREAVFEVLDESGKAVETRKQQVFIRFYFVYYCNSEFKNELLSCKMISLIF